MHNGHFDGALEFYTDVTDMRASVMNRARLLLSVIVGAVLVTMLSAGWLLHRNNARHVAQLNRRNTKEREIIDQQLQLAREVQLLGELNEWLQSSHSLEELFQMVARFMTPYPAQRRGKPLRLFQLTRRSGWFSKVEWWNRETTYPPRRMLGFAPRPDL